MTCTSRRRAGHASELPSVPVRVRGCENKNATLFRRPRLVSSRLDRRAHSRASSTSCRRVGPSSRGGRMRYSSRRQSTPPMPRTRFRLARMRSGRVTPASPLKRCAVPPPHSRRKKPPRADHACSTDPASSESDPGSPLDPSPSSRWLQSPSPAPPPSRPVSSSSNPSPSKRARVRAAPAWPPRRVGHDEYAAAARSERDGPELVEVRGNVERGGGVALARLGERRVFEIRAVAVREMDEVFHPGGFRGALGEAQRAGVEIVSDERGSLAAAPRVRAEIRRLFQISSSSPRSWSGHRSNA